MLFGIILSVDVPEGVRITDRLPPGHMYRGKRAPLDCSEGDEQYEYDYLEGDWRKGHHRKLVGILTRPQFDALVDELSLTMEDCQTMGSLGVPWATPWYGLAPALSFHGEHDDAIMSMYVTPLPQCGAPATEDGQARAWDRLHKVMYRVYGPSGRGGKYGRYQHGYRKQCVRAAVRARRPATFDLFAREKARRARLLPNGVPRWVRCYDNGGETTDRYAVVFTGRYMNHYRVYQGGRLTENTYKHFRYMCASEHPTHPQGVCCEDDMPHHPPDLQRNRRGYLGLPPALGRKGPMGRRVRFESLPPDVQRAALETYRDLWHLPW